MHTLHETLNSFVLRNVMTVTNLIFISFLARYSDFHTLRSKINILPFVLNKGCWCAPLKPDLKQRKTAENGITENNGPYQIRWCRVSENYILIIYNLSMLNFCANVYGEINVLLKYCAFLLMMMIRWERCQ